MRKILLSMILISEIIIIGINYSKSITNQLSDELLRMHILANSDSDYDQKVKIDARNFLIEYIDKTNLSNKEQVVTSVVNMEDCLNEELLTNNINYTCKISLCNTDFNSREYSNISVPAGNYETLKVVLGEGKGKNWWCIAYPPLCFTESVTGEISTSGNAKLKSSLDNEAYNIINAKNGEYKIKFKCIELINSILKH